MLSTLTRHTHWHTRGREDRFFDTGNTSDPRLSSGASESPQRFPNATRTRMLLARTLGIAGILATVALAVFAFRSRAPAVPGRIDRVWDDVRLPWDPVLNAGPPLTLARSDGLVPLAVRLAASGATPTTSAAPAPAPGVFPPVVPVREGEKEQVGSKAAESPLTAEEVQRRRDRYERWLVEQRLQRIE